MTEKSVETTLTIQNRKGLHARAAAAFVKTVENFDAEVVVDRLGQTVSGTSIMGLMMLSAAKGSQIHVTAKGVAAEEAIRAVTLLVQSKFGEE